MAGATRTTRTPRPPRARGRREQRGRRAVRSASASSRAHSCSAPPGKRAPHCRHTCGVGALLVHACEAPLQIVQYVGAPTSGALPKYALLQYYTVKCVACQLRCQRLVQSACVHVHAHVTLCELLQVRARTCNPGLTYYILKYKDTFKVLYFKLYYNYPPAVCSIAVFLLHQYRSFYPA